MNIEKEIKFYTAMYKEFYDFVKNDKKRSTTFMNQSKKLFPSENVEKLITPKGQFSKFDKEIKDGLDTLLDWLESGIRSFSQEQKVKEIRSRFNSYKINKEASKDTPIKEAKPKETKVEKSKEVKPKESKTAGKILEPSKIIYELYQFVSKDKKRSKSFTNRLAGIEVSKDELNSLIEALVDEKELEKFNSSFSKELILDIMEFIKSGLRSVVQTEKFLTLKKDIDSSLDSIPETKSEVKKDKTKETKSATKVEKSKVEKESVSKGKKETIFKYPVRKINYNKIISKDKSGKVTIADMEKLHKPVNTLRLKLDEKELQEKFLTHEFIDNLQGNVIQNESEIFEQYPITISIEEIDAIIKFVHNFEKEKEFKERLSKIGLSDFRTSLLEKNNTFQIIINTRTIWLEFVRFLIDKKLPKRSEELVKLFLLPNYYEYIDTVVNLVPQNTKVISTKSKSNYISWYMSTKYISITLDNTVTNIHFGDPRFLGFKKLIEDINDTKISDSEFIEQAKVLLKTESTVQQELAESIKDFLKVHKNVKIIDNNVVVNNVTFSGSQAKDLMDLIKIKNIYGMSSLLNFLKNLSQNPSEIAKKELYNFCMNNGLPITPAGTILMYKWVKTDYLDAYTGTLLNKPGVIVWQKRELCDLDSNNSCSTGLHLASFGYGKFSDKLLVTEMNPADCIAVPDKYDNNKLRCTAYKILLEASDFYEKGGLGNKDFLVKILGHHNPNILERQIFRLFGNNFARVYSQHKNVKCAENINLFFKNPDDYIASGKIKVAKTYTSKETVKKFTLKTVQQKTPIKEISEDKINEIKKYLNDVDYNTIKFTLDDINYFIANEPHDIISVYELILDFAEKDRNFNHFKDFFLEKPLEFSLKMDNNNFLEFMKAWKKLIVEFLSLADIPKSVYMNNDKNGSSVIEVLDKGDNKKVSDLSELKILWNTITK